MRVPAGRERVVRQRRPKWRQECRIKATDGLVRQLRPLLLSERDEVPEPAVRKEVQAIDRDQPIAAVRTMGEWVDRSTSTPRYRTTLLGLFAVIAMILAATGIYGVMSYSVAQRTHEIGIRMALGARRLDVLNMVVRQGMLLVVIGLAIGLLGAFALTRVMASLLFGVTAKDPITFVAVAGLLAVVALIACYIPARRATKVDPLTALRYE